jgi:hypothetical protein
LLLTTRAKLAISISGIKACRCIIFIGPNNVQYTSKPNRGLYTVLQNLAQSKGVLSNEVTSERCSSMFSVNALVSYDSTFRLLSSVSPFTLYSR